MSGAELAISATDARRITEQIKVSVEAVWHLISQAYTSRAWSVLGYPSWDDYCTREFGTSRLRLPREERQEVVVSLRESGLSLRAIASATGDSEGTVRNALKSGAQNYAPEPDADPEPARPITGTDGKAYPAKPRPSPAPAVDDSDEPQAPMGDAEAHAEPVLDPAAAESPEADYAALNESMAAHMAGKAVTFRANWATATARCNGLLDLDKDRAVDVVDRDDLLRTVRRWNEWVGEMEARLRPNLQIVRQGR